MTGILALPLLWSILRALWPRDHALHRLTAILFITSPSLLLYSQEARMYPIMLCLALFSIYFCLKLPTDKRLWIRVAFILCNWLMVGYHYYSALLIMAQGLFLFIILLRSNFREKFLSTLLLPIMLSMLPGALWVGFSPGFQDTFSAVASSAEGLIWQRYLDQLWRELIFGNVRWLPEQSWYSYLLLPLFCLGMGAMIWDAIRNKKNGYGAWLFCLILIIPILFSIIAFQKVKIRYLIYITVVVYTALAYGLLWLTRIRYKYPLFQIVGHSFCLTSLLFTGLITVNALDHYFQKYQKSAYREMATYLQTHLEPTDGILLEAPRHDLPCARSRTAQLLAHQRAASHPRGERRPSPKLSPPTSRTLAIPDRRGRSRPRRICVQISHSSSLLGGLRGMARRAPLPLSQPTFHRASI